MEILLLSTYATLAWLTFKVFKVPVNKWTVTTAILGGVLLISSMVVLMNYNHPYTSNSRAYFVSTPIITNVSSSVTQVYVTEQQDVKKGDTLFTLDSTLFINRLHALEAQYELASLRLEELQELLNYNAGSKFEVEEYAAQIAQIEAQMEEAKWKVKQCVVVAPSDGIITQNRLRKGMRSVEFPLRPVMTFINTNDQYIVGAFPQNPSQRLKIGNEAEVVFDAIPGEIFKGEVTMIGSAVAQGELQAMGTLYNFDAQGVHVQGSVPYVIKLHHDMSEYTLPNGAKAQMAIYSEYIKPVQIIRMVLMRMKGWLNYLFGEH